MIRKKGEPIPEEPMDVAGEYVAVKRRRKAIKAEDAALASRSAELEDVVARLMEAGKLSLSFKADGASVFQKYEVWAGAPDSPDGGKDHARLTTVLKNLGLVEYLPTTVNTQSLSAYIRDHLTDTPEERLKPLMQRLQEGGVPQELLDVIKLSEKHPINANGL